MRLKGKIMKLVNLTVVITLFLSTLNIISVSIALSMSETQEANEAVMELNQPQTSSFDPIDDTQCLSNFKAYPPLNESLIYFFGSIWMLISTFGTSLARSSSK